MNLTASLTPSRPASRRRRAGVGTVADEQQHRVAHLGPHPRPGPDQGVLALARDQPGHADHHRPVAQAQPVPDRGAARSGAEERHVDAGRQPHHALGRLRGQRAGQPDPDVLAQVGHHVDLVADAAEQAAGDRQRSPAGLVTVRQRHRPGYPGPAQRGRDQARAARPHRTGPCHSRAHGRWPRPGGTRTAPAA